MDYEESRFVYITFMRDTNAINARQADVDLNQIDRWQADGVVEVLMSAASSTEARAGGNSARSRKAVSHIYSYIGASAEDEEATRQSVAAALFPAGIRTDTERNDIEIVFHALKYRAILVTNDGDSRRQPGGILGNREVLARLGSDPMWAFPVVGDFCSKLFDPTSEALLKATASYLDQSGIPYDPKLLSLRVGASFSGDDIAQGPIGIFLGLEAEEPNKHNIERLCEHVWQAFGRDPAFWAAFIHNGIFLKLFAVFSEQFGLGSGRPMEAGRRVASALIANDVVLNLNYDIAFDLALKQAGKSICYAPEVRSGATLVLKPHGSFNFYLNLSNGNCFFEEPDRIHGSVGIPDPAGGVFFPQHGIVPPRLNKSYGQHPSAQAILETKRPFLPKFVTFWGVGLTDSDLDLLDLYREAVTEAETVDFINPSSVACENAVRLLRLDVRHFPTLESWFASVNCDNGESGLPA